MAEASNSIYTSGDLMFIFEQIPQRQCYFYYSKYMLVRLPDIESPIFTYSATILDYLHSFYVIHILPIQ